jgi:polysaccharide deacetylase family protein (PEP-CTERM system associated)
VSEPLNAFTVDLEDWFHVCGVGGALGSDHWDQLPSRIELTTHILLDALARADVRATFFVVGWIAERHPRLIEAVRDAGHEFGSHGYRHERVYDLGPEEFARDLHQSVQALDDIGVPGVTLFRAPEWSINDRSLWALDQLARDGFTLDSSMAPLKIVGSLAYPRHPHLRHTAAGAVVEAPPLVADRFGQTMPMGWGWGLRMSSPDRILRTIEAGNCAGSSVVLTVHPWELDPNPPRMRLPAARHFAHYFRLSGFGERLREVLARARFGPIGRLVPSSP